MQNIHDFEERVHAARKEIAAILAGERPVSSGSYIQHAAYIAARSQKNHPAAQGSQPLNRKERTHYNQQVKPAEETSLKQWAKENGLWVEAIPFNKQYSNNFLDEGAEQKVYLNQSGKTVVKINTGIYHGTWLEFLIRLILHLAIFPSTEYRLTGFSMQANQFSAILEQPFVDIKAGASNDEIENFLSGIGFINLRNYDYYSAEDGILLEDLHDENVFKDEQGVLYFIDPVIYLETPDLGLDGRSQFHFPF
jgi:hypothetical protein